MLNSIRSLKFHDIYIPITYLYDIQQSSATWKKSSIK